MASPYHSEMHPEEILQQFSCNNRPNYHTKFTSSKAESPKSKPKPRPKSSTVFEPVGITFGGSVYVGDATDAVIANIDRQGRGRTARAQTMLPREQKVSSAAVSPTRRPQGRNPPPRTDKVDVLQAENRKLKVELGKLKAELAAAKAKDSPPSPRKPSQERRTPKKTQQQQQSAKSTLPFTPSKSPGPPPPRPTNKPPSTKPHLATTAATPKPQEEKVRVGSSPGPTPKKTARNHTTSPSGRTPCAPTTTTSSSSSSPNKVTPPTSIVLNPRPPPTAAVAVPSKTLEASKKLNEREVTQRKLLIKAEDKARHDLRTQLKLTNNIAKRRPQPKAQRKPATVPRDDDGLPVDAKWRTYETQQPATLEMHTELPTTPQNKEALPPHTVTASVPPIIRTEEHTVLLDSVLNRPDLGQSQIPGEIEHGHHDGQQQEPKKQKEGKPKHNATQRPKEKPKSPKSTPKLEPKRKPRPSMCGEMTIVKEQLAEVQSGDCDSIKNELARLKAGTLEQETSQDTEWGRWEVTQAIGQKQKDQEGYETPDDSESGSDHVFNQQNKTQQQEKRNGPPSNLGVSQQVPFTVFKPKPPKPVEEEESNASTSHTSSHGSLMSNGTNAESSSNPSLSVEWGICLTPDTKSRDGGAELSNLIGKPLARVGTSELL